MEAAVAQPDGRRRGGRRHGSHTSLYEVEVTALSVTAIKGTRLRRVDSIELGRTGARGDRRFFLIDARNRMVNGTQLGDLQSVTATFEESSRRLALDFPGGSRVEDLVGAGPEVLARFFSREVKGRIVEGPWSAALSEHVGREVRLVETASAVDRGIRGAVTLISQASLARLAAAGGIDYIDARRFRMLIEIDGVAAHAEDQWAGRRVRIGGALIRFEGHVGRCIITSRDPETGVVDLPTLTLLGEYRRDLDTTEPLPFGIYGSVLDTGAIRVGDAVALET